VEKKRSQRGSNPRNCLGKSHLRRRGCERKRTETHQGDRVTVNMVQLDDPGGVACKKRQRDLESVSFRHLGRVEFCSDLHSTLKQLDCSEWASRISTNLGLYSCESLIGFSEALNSCTYIYEPNSGFFLQAVTGNSRAGYLLMSLSLVCSAARPAPTTSKLQHVRPEAN
jgi:hypothetical protein